ncbi:MAG: GNAT family N-acetyltransferase [Micrococcales bacterium]|nr:GNAT family N-acetyltransferase [Micrococcales bacterium]
MAEAGPAPEVRLLDPADWAAYRDVRLAMLEDSPEAFLTTTAEALVHDEPFWRERLTNAPTWVAGSDGAPLGAVSVWAAPDLPEGTLELIAMWVAPAGRRRGVGRALVTSVLRYAAEQGCGQVHLGVFASNAPAVQLYEACGFAPTGTSETVAARPGERILHLARAIAPSA